jgi:DNA-binding GntR family transcriptional regulator
MTVLSGIDALGGLPTINPSSYRLLNMSSPLGEAADSPWLSAGAPRRSVLGDEVYELIKSRLMDNLVEPGSRLSIDGLARDFGCSPTPVREALARLESDGLVAKRAHHGYTVAPLMDAKSFDELFRVRLLLEPAAASWAAERASRPQVKNLKDLIAEMEEPVKGASYESYKAFAAQDAAFHLAIASTSGVDLMVDILERLRPHSQLYRLYYETGIAMDTVLEHQKVLDAVADHDVDGAAEAMRFHLHAARGRLAGAANVADEAQP